MKRKFRVFSILFLWAIVFILPQNFASAAELRFSTAADKFRLVLELPADASYVELPVQAQKIQYKISTKQKLSDVNTLVQDELVSSLVLDAQSKLLTINLKKNSPYKTLNLINPKRLVVDIYKQLEKKEQIKFLNGLEYTSWRNIVGGRQIWLHILRVDSSQYQARPFLAKRQILGRETVSKIVAGEHLLAGINAAYFDADGTIIGNTKLQGQIVSTEDMPRASLAISDKWGYKILETAYQGEVILPSGKRLDISAVNRERLDNDLILYNSWYGSSTKTNPYGLEVLVCNGVVQSINPQGNTSLQAGQEILSAHGTMQTELSKLKIGDKVIIRQTLGEKADAYDNILGAGPLLVKAGKILVTAEKESFPADIAVGKAPRSAVGITADQQLLLVTVDGRSDYSGGVTLEELAQYLLDLGAVEAMNFDGGGSSTLVVLNKLLNNPSDGNRQERAIGNILGITRRKLDK